MPGSIITRFGHVLSSKDGLYPYLKMAALCGVQKLGSKDRYVPWVHVEDVAGAIVHCAENPNSFKGKELNIASP
jgi:NAD dependent epimerase/dehydratase family enzyme